MKKKTVLAILILISLLFTMLETQFIIVPVEADSGTIYVDAGNIGDPSEDGSLDHPFDKIQEGIYAASSGETVFVYSGTYSEHVFVNKSLTLIGEDVDTTIIEGVSGPESVIECYNASNVKISGFTIWKSPHGINLNYCNNITISGNMVTSNSQYGIFLKNSRSSTISDNMVLNNGNRGIYVRSSSNNTVRNNTVSNHREYGIYVYSSSNNVVSDNTISNTNDRGIWLNGGKNNIFSDNTISKNYHGFYILYSTRNTLRNNDMTGNRYNFFIDGSFLSHFIHDIDPSNIVDGKPVYYWVNQHNKQVPSDAGYVALVNSTNITVKDLNLAKNRQGVLIANTTKSTIMNVNASYNYIGIQILESGGNSVNSNILTSNQNGIELIESNDNTLTHNIIKNNDWGIRLYRYSNCNTLYHNYFINNTNQVQAFTPSNVWDDGYPSGGNYWSDYTGEDANSDGIGDIPYLIPEDNQDNYPLMTPVVVDQITLDKRCDVGSIQTIAFHAIWAHNSSNVVRSSVYVNSTQYLTNSTGWISFNATRDTVGKLVWTITSFGSFYVIWDRVQIVEGGSSRAQTNITETETIWFNATYEYDGLIFDGTMGTLYVNGSAMTWSAVKERWEFNCTFNTPGTGIFEISGVFDGQYGLTAINDLAGAQSITWRAREVEEEEKAPFWDQWWFWTIIVIGIVIAMAVTAIYFLRKRKNPTPTPHSPPPPPVRGIAVSTLKSTLEK